MTLQQQMENFSIAYVRAIAAGASLGMSVPETDDDSIDLTLKKRSLRFDVAVRSPALDVQVKCSQRSQVRSFDSYFSFDLKMKNYDELRAPNNENKRILVVVLVPDQLSGWLDWGPEELTMRHAGYWVSLIGSPTISNVSQIAQRIPWLNQFSVPQLSDMLSRIEEGGAP